MADVDPDVRAEVPAAGPVAGQADSDQDKERPGSEPGQTAPPADEAAAVEPDPSPSDEEEAAEFIKKSVSKPVVAFVAGRTAPPGKRMGHAGAIISGGTGTAEEKVAAFESCGVPVATTPAEISEIVAQLLQKKTDKNRRQAVKKLDKKF